MMVIEVPLEVSARNVYTNVLQPRLWAICGMFCVCSLTMPTHQHTQTLQCLIKRSLYCKRSWPSWQFRLDMQVRLAASDVDNIFSHYGYIPTFCDIIQLTIS